MQDTDEELDVLLDKEILLSNLEAMGHKDKLLAHHLMSINPEMPDSIFSTEPGEEQEPSLGDDLISDGIDGNDLLNDDQITSMVGSQQDLQMSDDGPKMTAHGPLLMQHLQGTVGSSVENGLKSNSSSLVSTSSVTNIKHSVEDTATVNSTSDAGVETSDEPDGMDAGQMTMDTDVTRNTSPVHSDSQEVDQMETEEHPAPTRPQVVMDTSDFMTW